MSQTISDGGGRLRAAGWLLLVVGAGAAAGAGALALRARARTADDDNNGDLAGRDLAGRGLAALAAPAELLRARVERDIEQRARALESRAAEAAGLPELISGLELRADAHTFEDLLQTEDWWAPYRSELALSGIVVDGGAPVMLGPAIGVLPRADLVRRARDEGVASAVAAASGRSLLLAVLRSFLMLHLLA